MTVTVSTRVPRGRRRRRLVGGVLALAAGLVLAVGLFGPAAAASPPVVLSVSPPSGATAGGDTIDITGTGFSGLLGVKFGAVPAASYTFFDDSHIQAVTPQHAAGTVRVIVTTTNGSSGGIQAPDTFTFVATPDVDDIDPSGGPSAGGTLVTITGSGFTGATGVTFGGTPATAFSVSNDFVLTATAPPHAVGTVHVVVWAGATPSPSTAADLFTYTAGAVVTGVSPNYGPTGGGTVVSISGAGFTGATAITFGGSLVTYASFVSDHLLLATAPAHAAGPVDVVVWVGSTPSPTSASDVFTYTAGPVVTGISPVGGPVVGGTTVTVSGAGFTGATAVTFGGVLGSSLSVLSDNLLVVVSPPHLAGPADVVVWVGTVSSPVTALDVFTYTGGPIVTGVSPTGGSVAGGTVVTVSGAGFTGASAVTFGGSSGSNVTVLSDTRLLVTSPAHAAGAVHVVVWVGSVGSATSSADVFTYTGGPVVTGVSPTSGPPAGGTVVTITGSGFTGATAVTFGGTAGSGLSVTSDTRLVVISPARAAGAVDVVVWVGSVASATSSADLFTFTSATPSNPPARFAGTANVAGAGAGSGTSVEARVGSAVCGSATTFLEAGVPRYVIDVAAADSSHPGCGTEGAVVTFYVGGFQASPQGVWHSYQLNVLDLTVGGVPPTPTPPVTPTPVAPGPPDTGGGLTGGSAFPGLTIVGLGLMAIAVGGGLARLRRR